MNLPRLAADLRAAADMLEKIAAVFSPTAPDDQVVTLLALPESRRAAVASSEPRRAPPRTGGKLAKRMARKSPPVSAKRGGRVLTDARKEVLRRDWPAGVETPRILAALNRLSGPGIRDNQHVASCAASLKLHRPGGTRQARTAPAEDALPAPPVLEDVREPLPAPQPPRRPSMSLLASRDGFPSVAQRQLLESAAENSAAPVSWADAMEWAHRNKVPLGGSEEQDLRATNAARRELRLPPYRIVERRGLPERLPAASVGGSSVAA